MPTRLWFFSVGPFLTNVNRSTPTVGGDQTSQARDIPSIPDDFNITTHERFVFFH
jgi:hypothetical protein